MTERASKWLVIYGLVVSTAVLIFITLQQIRHTNILSTSDWCARAIKAEAITQRGETSCSSLMSQQIGAMAINSHIYAVGYTLTLLAVIVIMVVRGNLSFQGPGGFGGSLGSSKEAAKHVQQEVTDAADAAVADIAEEPSP